MYIKKKIKNWRERVRFVISRDNKHDLKRKDKLFGKEINVVSPRYKAKAYFNDKTIEFEEHEFGVTYINVNFKQKTRLPKNRNEHCEDYFSSGDDMIILSYKLKNKEKIITKIEIIGNTNKRMKSNEEKRKRSGKI